MRSCSFGASYVAAFTEICMPDKINKINVISGRYVFPMFCADFMIQSRQAAGAVS